MKRKVLFIAAAIGLTVSLHAQDYINSLTGTPLNSVVQADWNLNNANPTALCARTSGFAILTFNETTGGVVNANGLNIDPQYVPDATAQAGANEMVIGHTNGTIYYSYVVTNTSANTYTFSFPRTIGSLSNILPIDIVYDGSTYFYALFSATNTANNTTVFAYIGITAATGATSTLNYFQVSSDSFFPHDLEFHNTYLYMSGLHVTAAGGKSFFLARATPAAGNPVTSRWTDFPYSTHGQQPAHFYVKAVLANTVYLLGDMSGGVSSPLIFIKMTDLGATYSIVSAVPYSYNMLQIVSIACRANYIVVGSADATTLQPINFLYFITTSTVTSISSYTASGGNHYPQSIYSPVSARVFSVLRDNPGTILYDLRTFVNNCSTMYCPTPVNYLSGNISITPVDINATGFSVAVTTVGLSPSSVGLLYNPPAQQCLPLAPQTGGPLFRSTPPAHAVLSPNPSSDQLQVTTENGSGMQSVTLYDLSGRMVADVQAAGSSGIEFSVMDLTPGIYLAVIRHSDGSVQQEKILVGQH